MGYLNIGPSDIYAYSAGLGSWAVNTEQPGISINMNAIDSIRDFGSDTVLQLIYSQGGGATTLYVGKNTQAILDLNTDPNFLYVAGPSNWQFNTSSSSWVTIGYSVTINRSKIVSASKLNTLLPTGGAVYAILFEENERKEFIKYAST
jgi:hypothetical protein